MVAAIVQLLGALCALEPLCALWNLYATQLIAYVQDSFLNSNSLDVWLLRLQGCFLAESSQHHHQHAQVSALCATSNDWSNRLTQLVDFRAIWSILAVICLSAVPAAQGFDYRVEGQVFCKDKPMAGADMALAYTDPTQTFVGNIQKHH